MRKFPETVLNWLVGAFVVWWIVVCGVLPMVKPVRTRQSDPYFYASRDLVEKMCQQVNLRYRVGLRVEDFSDQEILLMAGRYREAQTKQRLSAFFLEIAKENQ